MIQLLGASAAAGFSTMSVSVTTSSMSVGSIAATPYCDTWSESTSISATTEPPNWSRTSIMRRSSGSLGWMKSSPSSTANGSWPTWCAAQSTAWPSPFGMPCRV